MKLGWFGTAAGAKTDNGPPKSHYLGQLVLVVATAWLAIAAIPGLPAPLIAGLDPSWVLGVNIAHAERWVAGRDVVWTYGPLSYLYLPVAGLAGMYPVLMYKLGVYILWCVALFRLSFVVTAGLRYWVVPVLGVAIIIDPFICADHLAIANFHVGPADSH